MVQAALLLLQVSAAILVGASLSPVSGSAVHLIIDEVDEDNKTIDIDLNIDIDDVPEDLIGEILQGNYNKLIQLDRSIAAMNESSIADDNIDGQEDARWDRSIIGRDDRLPVNDRSMYRIPYCAIGYLESGCTAAFIGPNHALTAAHCVYNKYTKTYETNLDLWRRQTCNSPGTQMHYANKSYVPQGYL